MSLRQTSWAARSVRQILFYFQAAKYRPARIPIAGTCVRVPSHNPAPAFPPPLPLSFFHFLNLITAHPLTFSVHTSQSAGKRHAGHKSADTARPVQAWCNIQGFIQSLHTVHQSEIYSEPLTKGDQVHQRENLPVVEGGWQILFDEDNKTWEYVWFSCLLDFFFLILSPCFYISHRCHSRSNAQERQVGG